MATIKEIAEIVGVSSAAVSRVLNYDEGISVSEETREAILPQRRRLAIRKKLFIRKLKTLHFCILQIMRMNWRMCFTAVSGRKL